MKRRVSIWLTVIFGVGAVVAVSAWILRAVVEVRNNRGAETYENARGLQVHWVDVLTMWAAVLLATLGMVVAIAIHAWRRKRDAALIAKLEARIGHELTVRDK
jgi:hypothetical protein